MGRKSIEDYGLFRCNRYLYWTEEDWDAAEQFASVALDISRDRYIKRGAVHLKKVKQDLLIGKLAELALYRELRNRWFPITPPDLGIGLDRAGYLPDLYLGSNRLHLKCNTSRTLGWVVTRRDPIITNPDPNDYFVMLTWHQSYFTVEFVKHRADVVFEPMAKRSMRRDKLCVLPIELREVYMKMKYPAMQYIDGGSLYELNIGLQTKQITEDRILSVESYFDENDEERFRLWYFNPATVERE